jgi:sugar O-acyltransferase (sialic acid O-acetyltransferase NeuD family)
VKVVIVGAGGHGQVVADVLLKQAEAGGSLLLVGFVDDDQTLHHQTVMGIPVLGAVSRLSITGHDAIVVAVGDNRRRHELCAQLNAAGETLVAAVHPSAVIGSHCEVEAGAMICAGAVVSTGSRIRFGAIVNTAATVDHHSDIGACAHIAPGVHMGGQVCVGEAAMVGIGSTVLPKVRIGASATVGAGAVVIRDVPANTTVVGIPAGARSRTL